MYNSYERYVTTTCADEYGVSAHIDQTTGSMCTCSTRVRVWEKREPSIWRYNHMPPCKYLFYFYFLNITLFQFNIFLLFKLTIGLLHIYKLRKILITFIFQKMRHKIVFISDIFVKHVV